MPKGQGLSEATKEGIWELRAEGLSDREVGRRLGLARGIVSGYLARAGGPPALPYKAGRGLSEVKRNVGRIGSPPWRFLAP
jgi:hypothetical protein